MYNLGEKVKVKELNSFRNFLNRPNGKCDPGPTFREVVNPCWMRFKRRSQFIIIVKRRVKIRIHAKFAEVGHGWSTRSTCFIHTNVSNDSFQSFSFVETIQLNLILWIFRIEKGEYISFYDFFITVYYSIGSVDGRIACICKLYIFYDLIITTLKKGNVKNVEKMSDSNFRFVLRARWRIILLESMKVGD